MKKQFLILLLFFVLSGCNDKPEIKGGISIFPNPATDGTVIYINSQASFTLFVFDTYGKTLVEQSGDGGNYSYQLPLADKPKGTYHVILKTKTGTFKQNLLKL